MMKRRQTHFFFISVVILMVTLNGCALFKKKCDCPGFGRSEYHPEPMTATSLPGPEKDQGSFH
jgi:hypothetical protein